MTSRQRAGILVRLTLSLTLLGCVEPRSGQFTCADGMCPDGLVCQEGLCVEPGGVSDGGADAGRDGGPDEDGGGEDGGVRADAAGPDGGVDAGHDAGPDAEVDAGACVDMDMDMACAPLDCDDGDPAVNPAADESCDLPGVDDDCDGVVDEGCPLSFSGRHMTTRLLSRPPVTGGANVVFSTPELNASGTRLYFVSSAAGKGVVWVAVRTFDSAVGEYGEFGAPTPVSIGGLARQWIQLSITGDGLEIFLTAASAPATLYSAIRTSETAAFPEPTPLSLPGGMRDPRQASVSRDGLELVVVEGAAGSRRMAYYTRGSSGDAWSRGTATLPDVTNLVGDEIYPRLSADALTLWYMNRPPVGGDVAVMQFSRESRSAPFDTAEPPGPLNAMLASLGGTGRQPFLHAESGELWFIRERVMMEAPLLDSALMRARVCRTPSCALPTRVDCTRGARTSSQFECLMDLAANVTGEATLTELPHQLDRICGEMRPGTRIASVHTPEERTTIAALYGAATPSPYIGLVGTGTTRGWINGDPYFGTRRLLAGAQSARLRLSDGTWIAGGICPAGTTCSVDVVCEREIWPTWPAAGPR